MTDRSAWIIELEEWMDMLDADALRFVLDCFLGKGACTVEAVEAAVDLIPKDQS